METTDYISFDIPKIYEPLLRTIDENEKKHNYKINFFFKRCVKTIIKEGKCFATKELIDKNTKAVESLIEKLKTKPTKNLAGNVDTTGLSLATNFIRDVAGIIGHEQTYEMAGKIFPEVKSFNVKSDVRAFYDFIYNSNSVFLNKPKEGQTKLQLSLELFDSWALLDLHELFINKNNVTYLEQLYKFFIGEQ
jgi:hypothetical protein